MTTGFVERVVYADRGKRLAPGELSAFQFQRWLERWLAYERGGGDVVVLVSKTTPTAIAIGPDLSEVHA